ncbi:MAG TPA: tRNA lysidine(34) synthetase TilS [Deltaproteobacteria bacterium]|nr:tRNA lysidine(34) synthetase TilS [Deltaproteobacteria bacterium]
MSMLRRFVRTLKECCSLQDGDTVLVCCSGGIDSMVLLHLMNKASSLLGLGLGVIHVDHGIRGTASKKDAIFVAGVCRDMQIPFYGYELHMEHTQENLEEHARILRYDAVMKCKNGHGFDYAATGHTMDDQAETLIYRIIRGSGIRGLAGMRHINTHGLIRPMLGLERDEITRYAAANDIGFVNDSTNNDTTLARNFIRHKILPLMKRINPETIGALSRLSDIARGEGEVLEAMASSLREQSILLDWNLIRAYRAGDLISAHEAVAKRTIISILTEMLGEPRGIDAIQVQGVFDVLMARKRAHTVKRRVRAVLDGKAMVFMDAGKETRFDMQIQGPGIFRIQGLDQAVKIDFTQTDRVTLRLRSLNNGDRVEGKKAVKILSDKGVMNSQRRFWPILLSGDEIISIPGIIDTDRLIAVHTEFPYHE